MLFSQGHKAGPNDSGSAFFTGERLIKLAKNKQNQTRLKRISVEACLFSSRQLHQKNNIAPSASVLLPMLPPNWFSALVSMYSPTSCTASFSE